VRTLRLHADALIRGLTWRRVSEGDGSVDGPGSGLMLHRRWARGKPPPCICVSRAVWLAVVRRASCSVLVGEGCTQWCNSATCTGCDRQTEFEGLGGICPVMEGGMLLLRCVWWILTNARYTRSSQLQSLTSLWCKHCLGEYKIREASVAAARVRGDNKSTPAWTKPQPRQTGREMVASMVPRTDLRLLVPAAAEMRAADGGTAQTKPPVVQEGDGPPRPMLDGKPRGWEMDLACWVWCVRRPWFGTLLHCRRYVSVDEMHRVR
jgi:hypothetical protein